MAKKRILAEADTEIAALRAQLVTAGAPSGEEAAPIKRFPCVMYRKAKVTERAPNGYEARRVKVEDDKGHLDEALCDAAVATMTQAGWVHSPDDLL